MNDQKLSLTLSSNKTLYHAQSSERFLQAGVRRPEDDTRETESNMRTAEMSSTMIVVDGGVLKVEFWNG